MIKNNERLSLLGKSKEENSFSNELFNEIFIKNPILVSAVGLCPVVAICISLKFALVLCIITILTMLFTQVMTVLFIKKLSQWIRMGMYTILGMLIVAPSMFIINKIDPKIMSDFGFYLPLLAINPLIVRQCESVTVSIGFKSAVKNSIASSLGYSVILFIVGFIREVWGTGSLFGKKIFSSFASQSLLMPFAGFVIIAFLAAALRLYFRRVDPQYAEDLTVSSRSSIKTGNKTAEFTKMLIENKNDQKTDEKPQIEILPFDTPTKNIQKSIEEEEAGLESINDKEKEKEKASESIDENLTTIKVWEDNILEEKGKLDKKTKNAKSKIEEELEELVSMSVDDILDKARYNKEKGEKKEDEK